MKVETKSAALGAVAGATVLIAAYGGYVFFEGNSPTQGVASHEGKGSSAPSGVPKGSPAGAPLVYQSLDLSPHEFEKFKVEPVREHDFRVFRETVGNIDFNRERSVKVFAPFAGKIIETFASAGDDLKKGGKLFTIDSPDLLEAASKLVAADGTLKVTSRALERAKRLYEVQGVSQKDLDQAVSDEQTAEAALKAARDAVRIFGKSEAEIGRIVAERKVDSVLVVYSPISGRITERNAAPGLFVQPGTDPAPFTISDLSTMWMLASVAETDFPLLSIGQQLDVTVQAYPGRTFRGKIVNIGAAVDPNTRRVLVRSEVRDPKHELRAGMFATFVIRTGKPMHSLAVPESGVVRAGDGTMVVWVNTEKRRLTRRLVKTGLQQDGLHQILEGLQPGERIATEGAIFLSNALTSASR